MVHRLQGNITTRDITAQLGTDRPSAPTGQIAAGALNILVMGSDSRAGNNSFIGGEADQGRSDTTILLHLAGDHRSAVAVSIPRDTMVDMPACIGTAGERIGGGVRQFNDAYSLGGPACTTRVVEQITKIRIDHFVVVDFAGFKNMVNALGSVEVCLPKPVDDAKARLHLPAGRSRVNGDVALAYVRERYALGDGSDLGRIGRQQDFIASVLQQVTSGDTLTNPARLYSFLSAATSSLTMDPELSSLPTMIGLAQTLRQIGLHEIKFVTAPTGEYPADRNRLELLPAADDLWGALRQDATLNLTNPGTATKAAGRGGAVGAKTGPASSAGKLPTADVQGRDAQSSICGRS
jgi:LCP family protein required for cell wall assembly